MSRLLKRENENDPIVRFGSAGLFICREPYTNSAAKFWTSLVDEIMEDVPDCDRFTLRASGSVPFTAELLDPQNSLQKDFDSLMDRDFEEVMREAMEELELGGLPTSVQITLFSGEKELTSLSLPLDALDAGLFNYLVAWLFKWAEVPEPAWNGEAVKGVFLGDDRVRKLRYTLNFDFTNRHLSEGLFERSVSVQFARNTFTPAW